MESVETEKLDEKRKLTRTFLDDLESPDLSQSFRRDLSDLYHFYLDKDSQRELEEMSPATRWLNVTFWILREMFFRLTPVRRLMLVIGLFLALSSFYGPMGQSLVSILIILTVLILELKDKLLAQSELATGRVVQLALMPEASPKIGGWDIWLTSRPANEVGGDLVDHLTVGSGRLGISLGDVAGKGLGAAMYMAKLQATIRALAPSSESLSELASEINSIFRRDGLPSRFSSLLYMEVEEFGETINMVNAGHLPALHVHGQEIVECPRGSPAIGLMDSAVFDEQTLTLAAGDYLVVYSDGIPEARNIEGTFFGEARLKRLLLGAGRKTAVEVGIEIVSAIDRFAGEARQNDDVSLIVLRRLPL